MTLVSYYETRKFIRRHGKVTEISGDITILKSEKLCWQSYLICYWIIFLSGKTSICWAVESLDHKWLHFAWTGILRSPGKLWNCVSRYSGSGPHIDSCLILLEVLRWGENGKGMYIFLKHGILCHGILMTLVLLFYLYAKTYT